MKHYFFLPLLLILLFNGCASSRPAVKEIIVLTKAEKVLQKIKQNGNEIEKYFFIERNGQIIIKADVQYEDEKYNVVYYLEKIIKLENYLYEVPFTVYKDGTEAVFNDALIWSIKDSGSGLLLSFDDDYYNKWQEKFALFEKYNAKVTFFIQGIIPDSFYLNATNRGHDIGYHSLNHLDLRSVSRNIFLRETIAPLESYKKNGKTITSFAYPFGFYRLWMHNTLLQSFEILRGYGTTLHLYKKDEINKRFISSRAIDNLLFKNDDDFYKYISLILRVNKFLDKEMILPLTTHDISNAPWGISHKRLEYLLKTAADLKLTFYNYKDFSQH
ncbi:MAG: polysaccharide deacetylase family protein [Treponema sp.]|nr:polysaccharide deacetylase family protein [Treponema sp.]